MADTSKDEERRMNEDTDEVSSAVFATTSSPFQLHRVHHSPSSSPSSEETKEPWAETSPITHSSPPSFSLSRPSSRGGAEGVVDFIATLSLQTAQQEEALQRRQKEVAAVAQRTKETLALKSSQAAEQRAKALDALKRTQPPSSAPNRPSTISPSPPSLSSSALLTSQLQALSAMSAGSGPTVSGAVSQHADNTFAKVRDKMLTLTQTVRSHESTIAALQSTVTTLHSSSATSTQAHQQQSAATQRKYEEQLQQQLSFIDQLIADKAELHRRVEQVSDEAAQHEAGLLRRIESAAQGHAQAMQAQKEGLEKKEKVAREQWMKEERKRIKELTIKGMEGEVNRMADTLRLKQQDMDDQCSRRIREVKEEEEAEREKVKGRLREEKERWVRQREEELQQRLAAHEQRWEEKLKEERQQWEARYAGLIDRHQSALHQQQTQHEAAFTQYRSSVEQRAKDVERQHKEDVAAVQRKLELQTAKEKEEERLTRSVWQSEQQRLWQAKTAKLEAQWEVKRKADVDEEVHHIVERMTREQARQEEVARAAHDAQVTALQQQLRQEAAHRQGLDSQHRLDRQQWEQTVVGLTEQVEQLTSRVAVKARDGKEKEDEVAVLRAQLLRQDGEERERAKVALAAAERSTALERKTWEAETLRREQKHDADLALWKETVEAAVRRKDAMIAELSAKVADREERVAELQRLLREQQDAMLEVVDSTG